MISDFKARAALLICVLICIGTPLCLHGATPIPEDTTGPDVFSFSSADYYVLEDATNAWISVRMTPGNRGWSGAVDYYSLDGTAVAPADYTSVSNRLGITWPGVKSFPVPIILDGNVEGEETVLLRLKPAYDRTIISSGAATLHILDVDGGRVSFANATNGVNETAGTATITLLRTGPPKGILTVHYRSAAWAWNQGTTAEESRDFTAVAGSVSFGDGETNKTFSVPIFDDHATGRVRAVLLLIADDFGNARIGLRETRLEIYDDLPPRLSISSDANGTLQVSWPAACAQFTLEKTSNPPARWTPVSTPFTLQDGICTVAEPITGTNSLYRLRL